MSNAELLALFDREQRLDAVYPGVRREEAPPVIRHIDLSRTDPNSWIVHSRLNEGNAAEIIDREIAWFEELGHNFEWKLYAYDTPPDLKDRLAARGFEIGALEAVLTLNLAQTPPALLKPVARDVRRITDPAQIADVIAVQNEVWGEDFTATAQKLAEELQNAPEQLSLYIAYNGDAPVTTGWLRFEPGSQFAGLWGGSTVSAHRGQGYYTALVAARVQEAIRREARYLTIDAGPMSRPILEKFGFQLLTYTYPCEWRIKKDAG